MTVDQVLLEWLWAGPADAAEPITVAARAEPALPELNPTTLAAMPPDRRRQSLGDYLARELGRVLHHPAGAVDRDQTMTDLGVGSMTGLELRNRIQQNLGVALGLPAILRAENVRELAILLEGVLA